MRVIEDTCIIGIDNGYGNIKTANCCFPASVAAYFFEPVFKDNMPYISTTVTSFISLFTSRHLLNGCRLQCVRI